MAATNKVRVLAAKTRRWLKTLAADRRAQRERAQFRGLNTPQTVAARGLEQARHSYAERLVESPVFIMSAPRSGSTLLRSMLTQHSQLHAPHELHLRNLRVRFVGRYVSKSMAELGQDLESLKYLLWDRLLHHELLRHDKSVVVSKTPDDVLMWQRVLECWPQARFVFLLRNPAVIAPSWAKVNRDWGPSKVLDDVEHYLDSINAAHDAHGGLVVRYEDLTEQPEHELRRICEHLGVGFEAKMMNYAGGDTAHTPGLGDWSGRLRSGKVVSRRNEQPPPMPAQFAGFAQRWNY